jgi:hypothetical protein
VLLGSTAYTKYGPTVMENEMTAQPIVPLEPEEEIDVPSSDPVVIEEEEVLPIGDKDDLIEDDEDEEFEDDDDDDEVVTDDDEGT